jgi:hypothetical protein
MTVAKPFNISILRILCFSILLSVFGKLSAQQALSEKDIQYFKQQEKRLQALQKQIYFTRNISDSVKLALNKEFLQIWDTTLSAELSFSYPFDSLTQIGRLISPDKKFRIINWNIPKKDGTHLYFGFIQTYDRDSKKYDVEKLIDKSGTIKNPETHIGTPDKWFGMLYYDIIKTDNYYTLLAWDGNDKLVCRKFIDILYFKDNGDIVFGKDVFKMGMKNPRRVMYEYSSEVTMTMKYNDQKEMIIMDDLSPRDPMMEGVPSVYGPNFSYNAFEFTKGKWKYIPDIDVKNIKDKNDNIKHKGNSKERPVYVPH